jgi:hypothetical protein
MARPSILSLHEFALSLIPRAEAAAVTRERKFARLYLDPAVTRRIKRIAAEMDCSPHDLFVEGIDVVLRKYGEPSAVESPARNKPSLEAPRPEA